jgi:heme-degrading monooxygenase HmoA
MPTMSGPDAALAMRTLGFKGSIIGITGHEVTHVHHMYDDDDDDVYLLHKLWDSRNDDFN